MQYIRLTEMVVIGNSPEHPNTYPLEYWKEKYPDFLTKFAGKYVISGEPDKVAGTSPIKTNNVKETLEINQLTLEELKTLKVSDKIAKQIIEDRSNNKYITNIDELKSLVISIDWSKYNINYLV